MAGKRFKKQSGLSLLLGVIVVVIVLCIDFCLVGQSIAQSKSAYSVGIDERLGEMVDGSIEFRDEYGKTVKLEDFFGKPIFLTFVYFRCRGICPKLLAGVAKVLSKIKLEPGKDFVMLTVSFDPGDKPEDALHLKKNFLRAIKRPFDEKAWKFLTTTREYVEKITSQTGFKFMLGENNMFIHTAAMIVLSPEGKIVRYLYGTDFLPFDLQMAALEASKGRVGPTISRVLLYCFSYDPKGKRYALNIIRVMALSVVIGIVIFFVFLVSKKPHKNDTGV